MQVQIEIILHVLYSSDLVMVLLDIVVGFLITSCG